MKKPLLLTAATLVLVAAIHAQTSETSLKKITPVIKQQKNDKREELKKLPGTEVSPLAQQEFYKIYGNIPAVWNRTLNYDQVTFKSGGEDNTAYYDADAKLVGTLIQKKFADIPDDAQKYIKEHYPGYILEDVAFFNDNELNTTDISLFNKQFDDEDCFYVKLKKDNKEYLLKIKQTGVVSDSRQLD